MFAARDLKARSLLFLPFNMPLVSGSVDRPSGAVAAVLTVYPVKEEPASESFWIRAKAPPKGTQASARGAQAVALVPFWMAVVEASSHDVDAAGEFNLQYAIAIIQIPAPPPVAKAVRLQKGRMTLKVMCLTNGDAIARGTRLMGEGKPPRELPEDNLMGEENAK